MLAALGKRLNFYWRLIATAIAFSLFGVGGFIIPLISFPILLIATRDPVKRQYYARWLVHISFKAFIHIMRGLGILDWDIQNIERLNTGGNLILANHPTLLDVVFLVALIPKSCCVVKGRLLTHPSMKGFITLTGYIPNQEGSQLLRDSQTVLNAANNLIVFPEGTRSTAGKLITLQRGAANIAIRTQNDITPIIIKCVPSTLSKEHKWYDIPDRKFQITITIKEPMLIAPHLTGNPSVEARRLTQKLTTYFIQEQQTI